jgi:putative ABC transport system permease protein
MRLDALRRATGEDPLVSTVLLRTDPWLDDRIQQRLKELPYVAESTRRASLLEGFRVQSAGMIVTAALIISLFAGTITIGVVYNNARIVLSMRAREFATLRVLGFTRGEISAVLLGELGLQVLAALPLGLVLGRALVTALGTMTDPEAFRLPLLLTPRSYAFAASVTPMAATVSALLVRRRLDQLDLIGVLKARE